MWYFEHLLSLNGFAEFANYLLMATIPYMLVAIHLIKVLDLHGVDEYVIHLLVTGALGFFVVPAIVWGLPFIIAAVISAAIYYIIELFLTGKYQIVRKE
jgi:uncharacterized membrane protein